MEKASYFPAIEKESVNGIQQISLVTDCFSNRKIFLFGRISEETVYAFTMQMMSLMEDEQSEINIYINSPGGEVNSGLAIYDLIQSCKAPINMYCIGMAASMAAVIFSGGKKGRRFILPHSQVMIHEPLIPNGVGGSATSIKSTAESILQTRDLLSGILAKHTGKTPEEINQATDHDNYMTAEEAIAFGLCDKIVKTIK
ncbi:ATP-dependent Clp protease, protease subunit [Lachnospiraceae bacterium XBB2008]|nr:ATP-dependent Clp protease, protease subunit [Lachnospiraceae bacterium XBB2008]